MTLMRSKSAIETLTSHRTPRCICAIAIDLFLHHRCVCVRYFSAPNEPLCRCWIPSWRSHGNPILFLLVQCFLYCHIHTGTRLLLISRYLLKLDFTSAPLRDMFPFCIGLTIGVNCVMITIKN